MEGIGKVHPISVLSEAEQIVAASAKAPCGIPYKDAGEDTALNALFGREQGRINRLHILDQPFTPEVHYGESREMKLPRSGWCY